MSTDTIILIIVIIAYVTWALLNGFIASSRNHSFAIWVGISFCIMPPFAMIAMLIFCKTNNNHLIP